MSLSDKGRGKGGGRPRPPPACIFCNHRTPREGFFWDFCNSTCWLVKEDSIQSCRGRVSNISDPDLSVWILWVKRRVQSSRGELFPLKSDFFSPFKNDGFELKAAAETFGVQGVFGGEGDEGGRALFGPWSGSSSGHVRLDRWTQSGKEGGRAGRLPRGRKIFQNLLPRGSADFTPKVSAATFSSNPSFLKGKLPPVRIAAPAPSAQESKPGEIRV